MIHRKEMCAFVSENFRWRGSDFVVGLTALMEWLHTYMGGPFTL
jgi:hypothetical protein